MTPFECEFEAEVLAAALQDRWPGRVDAELRAHAAGCAVCSDVAAIAKAIEENRATLAAQAAIPDSGRVWWMAQLRARREDSAAASRPLTAAHAAGLVCALALLAACSRIAWPWFRGVLARMASADAATWFAPAARALAEHGAVALAMALVLLLLPAAAYLALGRD
ncbi:MAG TPA: hypothetical protein VKU19_06945 [Bryobacteraceae bacterium]|nr:hypothetical protein [Bryobacteraceae bacterium]